jgi:hypothetical protein
MRQANSRHVAVLLNGMDLDALWEEASLSERKILIEDLVDSVNIFPDGLTVQVAGAPPILVTLQEVGLNQGCKPNRPGQRHFLG